MTTLTASRGRLTFFGAALLCSLFVSSNPARADAADGNMRVMVFGAPSADCELKAGAVAAMWAKLGHKVKFVSTDNAAQPNSKTISFLRGELGNRAKRIGKTGEGLKA